MAFYGWVLLATGFTSGVLAGLSFTEKRIVEAYKRGFEDANKDWMYAQTLKNEIWDN